ncbi:FAD/NAD(P)-binding domain-containing protein [Mollisia scopiformis]|uniref:FAD/NAD(P)-binding domain-containing protein n=1 Tax=Mollisia scopiformis TaxID=149040 RepID=A0A132BCE1_MOLSC|nr:FAD/NAD(P)-binding domain-containing protein [Mollisia scopiformis]KUJ09933.1 FAD/NAD(P)-binding domain-containing protein [Mollisia scopiformis]
MRPFVSYLALVAGAYAQSSGYTDANTGITFQGYEDTTGFKYGMAVPVTPATDFIGQMVVPSNGSGYGGISLTGEMVGSLLIVAWPNSGSVVASLRETSGYTSPEAYTNASISLNPIANGTFVNSTHMSYTFVCAGCITGDSLSFSASATDLVVGWAMSAKSVTNPSSSSGATFVYHEAGYGDFGLTLTDAESSSYDTWASMATLSNTTSSNTTTCSSTSTNTTATVSNSTYDYIIAGAGPAGIIVAERLAETGKSVLLLERGAASTYATGGRSVVDWNSTVTQYDVPAMDYYLTTASDTSEYCTDVANMAGCILGGGTMVNAMMFVRPQERDFDDKWPTGWKWSDVSSSADRLYERNPGTTLSSLDGKRYDQQAFTTLQTFFSKAMGFSQVDAIQSPNAKTAVYSYPPWDAQDGLRAGPVKTYLPLANAVSNFKLKLNTKVFRAIRSNSTVTGVEVESSTGARQIINLNTGGSVILAGGSMSTPRILYNSGIGPTDQITTVQNGCVSVTLPAEDEWINLPVGQNLRDHPIFTLTFNATSINDTLVSTDFTSPSQTNIDLFAQGSGPLAQSGQRFNFWTSLNSTNGTRFFQGTCSSTADGSVRIKLYLTHGLTSTGVLGIDSNGATEFTTDPWMNTDADKAAVISMIDTIFAAARNSSIIIPSDASQTGASIVNANSYTQGDHFVGTTIIGETNDGTSVVDTNTKVWGMDNLFVVDASIHPDLPTGNTQAIVMVVAEHAAAKIVALASGGLNSTGSVTSGVAPFANNTTPAVGGDDDDDDACE